MRAWWDRLAPELGELEDELAALPRARPAWYTAAVRGAPEAGSAGLTRARAAARRGPHGDWTVASELPIDASTGEVLASAPYVPRSTRRCIEGTLWLAVQEEGQGVQVRSMGCGSWRCPKCGPSVNQRDYMRLRDAFRELEPSSCVFMTLTFDRREWASPKQAAQAACSAWQKLRQAVEYRLERRVGARRRRGPRLRYVMVFEQHRRPDGRGYWMHAHALVRCHALADWIRDAGTVERLNWIKDRTETRSLLAEPGGELAELARRSGWGRIDAQVTTDAEGLAGYLTKLAAEFTGSAAKKQTPSHAPRHFRRLRASRGFLAPARRAAEAVTQRWARVLAAPAGLVEWVQKAAGGRALGSLEVLAGVVRRAMTAPVDAALELADADRRGLPQHPPWAPVVPLCDLPF